MGAWGSICLQLCGSFCWVLDKLWNGKEPQKDGKRATEPELIEM